ncbi:MAG TPA: serine hydrolase [Thermoanaerobaculia bacterium]|nr:serine hydrolase [Thermoanaerobaculia bacterium]
MRTFRRTTAGVGLLFAATFAAAGPSVASKPHAPEKEDLVSLERIVPRLMKDGDVPGLSLAVVRDGRVVYRRNFGVRDASTIDPVDDDTIFEAASLSKPVFAYAVLKLVDAGRLDLNAPVQKYLPGDYVDDPRLRSITVRRVLSHTTGFPNWRPQGQPLKIHFEPGERFSYSGEGFVYLQKAVENLTGQTLEALVHRLVFEPLRMTSSSYTWQDRFEGRKAMGHDAVGTPLGLRRPAEASAAASLHTTARDYARFLAAVLDGTGLRKETVAQMIHPQIHLDEGCQNCINTKPTGRLSREIGWGLGWGVQETEDGPSIWHWGDNGGSGFHCYVVGFPRQRLGVVVFTNSLGGHGIIPDVVAAAVGGHHPAFAWLDYERWDSPARTWFKDILARGQPAVADGPKRTPGDSAPALTEQQVNRVGYWLLAKKKTKEAIAVFERNVADFPTSWNVHDSLGEAYAADGERDRAMASYEKSLALNPANTNGADQLRKLKTPPTSK